MTEDAKALRAEYSDIVEFARAYNPCVQHALVESKARKGVVALTGDVPTLSLLQTAYPAQEDLPQPAALWVKIQLEDFFSFCEQGCGVANDRVYELALIIVERYHFLNVLEIELWLADCKASATFYGAAGPLRMMELLKNYVVERNADIERVEAEIRAVERSIRHRQSAEYRRYYEEYAASASGGGFKKPEKPDGKKDGGK